MSNIFKRITSTVLAFVMAMSCVVINTSAETPETLYKFYANADDATANGDSISNNATTVFTNATTGTKAFTSGTYTVEGKDYKLEKSCSQRSFTIVVPANVIDATLTIVAKSSDTSSRTMTLKKGTVTIDSEKTLLDAAAVSYTGLSTGTYTLTLNTTTYYSLLTLKVPQIYEVSGTVTDNTGAAVKCATVSVGDDYTAQTDSNGKYSVLVKPGSYSINSTALGYFNSDESTITADKDVTKNFTLDKKKGAIYKFFGNADDATANYDSVNNNATTVFTNAVTSTSTITEQYVNVGGSTYKFSHYGYRFTKLTVVVPTAVASAELHMAVKVNTAYDTKLTLSKNGEVVDDTKVITKSSNIELVEYTGLSEGTYTLTSTLVGSTNSPYVYPSLMVLTTSPVHTLSGTVKDDTGAVVKSATINVNDKFVARSDNSGKYSLIIPEGDNTIKVTALNYSSADEETLKVEEDITRNYILKKGNNKIYKFYGNTTDATANYDSINNNAKTVFTTAATSTGTFAGGLYTVGGSTYSFNNLGGSASTQTIVVPAGVADASLYMAFYNSSSAYGAKFTLSKNGTVIDDTQVIGTASVGTVTYNGLSGGTYTLTTYRENDEASKLSVYTLLFTLSTTPVHTLSGIVKDGSGAVVKCATITVNDRWTARTNASGRYTLSVPEGTNKVKVTALNYSSSEEESISVEADTTKDFTLEKGKNKLYTFYGNTTDAGNNFDSINNNAKTVFTTAATGAGTFTGGTCNIGGSTYTFNYLGNAASSQTIVVPSEVTDATLYMDFYNSNGSYDAKITLSKDGTVIDDTQTVGKLSTGLVTFTGLSGGTYKLTSVNATTPTSNLSIYPLLFILSTSPVHTLSGTVKDDSGNAVKSATITVNGRLTARTNNTGKYTISVPEGTDTVEATALGYNSSVKLTVDINEDTSRDFTLKKKKGDIYTFYGNATDATTNYNSVDNNATSIFTTATTNTYTITNGTFNLGGSSYDLSYSGTYRSTQTIVVPAEVEEASLYMVLNNSSSSVAAKVTLSRDGKVVGEEYTINKLTAGVVTYTGLSGGTYTLTSVNADVPTSSLNLGAVLFILNTSQTYELSGTVTNDLGEAVKCATITVNDKLTARTDGTGKYSLYVPEGTNTVKATAFYHSGSEEVTIKSNKALTQNFTLKRNKGAIYTFYGNETDATANYEKTADNATDVFTKATTNTYTFKGGTFNIEGSSYELNGCGSYRSNQTIVVPYGVTDASLYMVLRNKTTDTDAKLILSRDGKVIDNTKTVTQNGASVIKYTGLSAGTYTLESVSAADGTTAFSLYPVLFMLTTSPTHVLSGTVTDTTGAVVKRATITVNDSLTTRTDDKGNYSITVPEGTDTVQVTAFNYDDRKGAEKIAVNSDTTKDFVLYKQSGELYEFYGSDTDAKANYDSTANNATDVFTTATVYTYSFLKGTYNIEGSSYEFTQSCDNIYPENSSANWCSRCNFIYGFI